MMAEDVKNGKIPNPPRKDGKSNKKFPTLKGFFNWTNFILSYFFHYLFKYRLTNYWAYESLQDDNAKSLRRTLGPGTRGVLGVGSETLVSKYCLIYILRPENLLFLAREVLQLALSVRIGTGSKYCQKQKIIEEFANTVCAEPF